MVGLSEMLSVRTGRCDSPRDIFCSLFIAVAAGSGGMHAQLCPVLQVARRPQPQDAGPPLTPTMATSGDRLADSEVPRGHPHRAAPLILHNHSARDVGSNRAAQSPSPESTMSLLTAKSSIERRRRSARLHVGNVSIIGAEALLPPSGHRRAEPNSR